jgi:hypothetical protein
MTINAESLRNLVIENRWTGSRLSATANQVSHADYMELTKLYKAALDALTAWASKDYAHTSTSEDVDAAFAAVKDILALFDDGETRIIIDKTSMRTMRDCATKPKRLYSPEYTAAMKAQTKAKATLADRWADLAARNVPVKNEGESLEDYTARVRESGIDTKDGAVDLLDLWLAAINTLVLKMRDVNNIKERGNYTWRRPVAVSQNEFADLVENYIGDCLEEGYNIKPSAQVRAEKAAADKARREEKKNA